MENISNSKYTLPTDPLVYVVVFWEILENETKQSKNLSFWKVDKKRRFETRSIAAVTFAYF